MSKPAATSADYAARLQRTLQALAEGKTIEEIAEAEQVSVQHLQLMIGAHHKRERDALSVEAWRQRKAARKPHVWRVRGQALADLAVEDGTWGGLVVKKWNRKEIAEKYDLTINEITRIIEGRS